MSAYEGRLPEGHPLLNSLRRQDLADEAAIDGDFIVLLRGEERLAVRARLSSPVAAMLRSGVWRAGRIELLAPQGEDTLAWLEGK